MEHNHSHTDPCAHESARSARAPEALAEAEKACAARGLRLTPIRKQVLETLYSTHRPMSAYEVIDGLALAGMKRLAPVTIYRALDFLMAEGFVHRIASRNAFIACPFHHSQNDLVVFMMCEACGGVDEMTSEPVTKALASLADTHHFRPHARVIELQGLCAHCHENERMAS
jgi:Fur family zinc uptake transcriptional regulator